MDATRIQTSQLGSDGTVLDACYTLAGDKVATCSSTGTVQVWSCSSTDQEWDLLHVEEVPDQPTQLAWAHPEHGLVLAIGTAQGAVLVLQGPAPDSTQQQQQQTDSSWRITGKLSCGQGAISTLEFAPRQYGLILAVGSHEHRTQLGAISGSSRVMMYEAAGIASVQLHWTLLGKIQLDAGLCKCLCWREASAGLPPLLVVGHSRGGSIWAYTQETMQWKEKCTFAAPFSQNPLAVHALHWAPALGRPRELLAVSYGATVVMYRVSAVLQDSSSGTTLASEPLLQLQADVVCDLLHPAPVWRLEFNMMGNTLACSLDGTPEIWFWMPRVIEEPWRVVSTIKGQQLQVADSCTMLD